MRTDSMRRQKQRTKREGFALVIVMVFAGISLAALGGALTWTSTSARQTNRAIEYYETSAAAEAASEKVLATLREDYQNGSSARVQERLNDYRAMTPTTAENAAWSNFNFLDGPGKTGTAVEKTVAEQYVELDSQYEGLRGWSTTYRITSWAKQSGGEKPIAAGVYQDVQTASIPIFQFAIFYGLDLELHSMTEMHIRGRVHSNSDIYTYPSETTTFWESATSVGNFIKRRKKGDPAYSTKPPAGKIIYRKKQDARVATLSLPIGTNNTPTAVREVLLPPPSGEAKTSAMSRERFYNKAELVILVKNNSVEAFAKAPYSTTTYPISWAELATMIRTNVSFTDQREQKVVKATEIDVSKIQAWSTVNANVMSAIGLNNPVNLIYIFDQRTLKSTELAAIRVKGGQVLPKRGLTIATPNPLYLMGHFNQESSSYLGTTNTTKTKPASLIADAITVLSPDWLDSESTLDYSKRRAGNMTVNAAILTGIVETSDVKDIYSGGAHNLMRFLEDWSGKTLTYNGSLVVLFDSVRATKPFQQPGEYYEPPERNFSFDQNFLDGTKLPPGTPELRGIIRGKWAQVAPSEATL